MSSSQRKGPRLIGRPPGASGERTREEILEGALEAFAETGYEAMSVRELTRQLDVSHNLVHHYFGSKKELWRAAVEHDLGRAARELAALLAEGVGSPSPVETLRAGIERAIVLLARHPAAARIVADEAGRGGERLDYIYDEFLQPGMGVLRRFLRSAQEHGIREVDPRVLVLFILSAASALFTHGALAEKLRIPSPTSGRSLDRYTESLVELILSGIVTPG
jgi:AcrR family transcriptional regulator